MEVLKIKNKKIITILIFLTLLLTITQVSAEDTTDTDLEVQIHESTTYKTNLIQTQNATVNITVKNNGENIATNIHVNASIPQGLIYLEHDTTKGIYNTNSQIWNIPGLEVGETATLHLTVMATPITEDIPLEGAIFNITVESDQNDPRTENNNASLRFSIIKGIDLVYTPIYTTLNAYLGEEYTYKVNIYNKGPSTPTVFGTSILPEDTSLYEVTNYTSDMGYLRYQGRRPFLIPFWFTITDNGDYTEGLKPGYDTNITFTIKPQKTGEIEILHRYAVPAQSYSDLNGTDNQAKFTINVHTVTDLSLDLTVNTTEIKPEDEITYTIKITNNGDEIAENVKLNISQIETLEDKDNIGEILEIGDINPKETITINLNYTIKDYGEINYTIELKTDSKNTNTENTKNIYIESTKLITITNLNIISTDSNNPVIILATLDSDNGEVEIEIQDTNKNTILKDTAEIQKDKIILKSYYGILPGNYIINLKTTGDSKTEIFTVITPTIKPIKTRIETILTLNYNNNTITGELKTINGENINDTIKIKINNTKTEEIKTNTTGYSLKLNLTDGEYQISAEYGGNENYTSSSNTTTIHIENPIKTTEIQTQTKIEGTYGEALNYTGILKDENQNPLIGLHIALNITRLSNGANKIYYLTTDYTGTYTIPINLAPGEYLLNAKIDELGYTTNKTTELTIKKETIETTLQTEDTIINYNNNEKFIGKIQTQTTAIPGVHLSLKLSNTKGQSKTYDVVSDYEGIFELPINLAPGIYQIQTSFTGLDKYECTNAENTITVQ